MIAQLRAADILAARQNNRYDNFARDLDQITVLDVYRATAPKNPFLVPDQETSGQCSVGVAFPEVITKHFAEVQVGIEQRLDQITVQQLVDETLANIAEHENKKGSLIMKITIFGKGNMGQAIGHNFELAGNTVTYVGSNDDIFSLGDLVIMAVPYPVLADLADQYGDQLAGKVVVDITNPLNFETWDELVVPADSSAAQELQKRLPNSKVLKAFNTTFAATLQSGQVGGQQQTTVLVAGDDDDAKATFKEALKGSPLAVLDAGKLKRARELEATGFLQMTLAASEQIGWTGGFGVIK